MKFLNVYFLQHPAPPSLSESKILFSILLCNNLYRCSILVRDRPSSELIKNCTGKFIYNTTCN